MQLKPSVIKIPIAWFLSYALVIILIIYMLKGHISIEDITFNSPFVLAGILAWKVGLHKYIFSFGTLGTTISTQLFGLLIRFSSSFLYLTLFVGIFFFDESARAYKAQYLIVLSIMSLILAFLLYRRIHLLEDTAHSTLNSAATRLCCFRRQSGFI